VALYSRCGGLFYRYVSVLCHFCRPSLCGRCVPNVGDGELIRGRTRLATTSRRLGNSDSKIPRRRDSVQHFEGQHVVLAVEATSLHSGLVDRAAAAREDAAVQSTRTARHGLSVSPLSASLTASFDCRLISHHPSVRPTTHCVPPKPTRFDHVLTDTNADQRLSRRPPQAYRRFNEGFFAEGVVSVVARTARSGAYYGKFKAKASPFRAGMKPTNSIQPPSMA